MEKVVIEFPYPTKYSLINGVIKKLDSGTKTTRQDQNLTDKKKSKIFELSSETWSKRPPHWRRPHWLVILTKFHDDSLKMSIS